MAAKGRAGRVDEKNDLIPKENHGYHTKYKAGKVISVYRQLKKHKDKLTAP